jgi:hypothetical protein
MWNTQNTHLYEDNEEKQPARNVDLLPGEHHGDATQLPGEVDDDKEGGEEPPAAPADVHVLALLGPLHPHPDAVLEEGRDEAKAGQVGKDVLRVTSDLK